MEPKPETKYEQVDSYTGKWALMATAPVVGTKLTIRENADERELSDLLRLLGRDKRVLQMVNDEDQGEWFVYLVVERETE